MAAVLQAAPALVDVLTCPVAVRAVVDHTGLTSLLTYLILPALLRTRALSTS